MSNLDIRLAVFRDIAEKKNFNTSEVLEFGERLFNAVENANTRHYMQAVDEGNNETFYLDLGEGTKRILFFTLDKTGSNRIIIRLSISESLERRAAFGSIFNVDPNSFKIGREYSLEEFSDLLGFDKKPEPEELLEEWLGGGVEDDNEEKA